MGIWTNDKDVKIAEQQNQTQLELAKEETNRSLEIQRSKSETWLKLAEIIGDVIKSVFESNKRGER